MASRKSRARLNQPQTQFQPSDYETDAQVNVDLPAPPPRSNEELNLSVLRRHYPSVSAILSIAPYAVLYLFSPDSQQWGKTDIEGTLFVCQLTPSPIGGDRFAVIILNRRGLDNFNMALTSGEDVENTDEYIILQVLGEDGTPKIYGLWIFSEPPPSSTANTRTINAQIIQDCAVQAEQSRKTIEERLRTSAESAEPEQSDAEESVPMGRQISLRQLFGQQREHDSAWSVHDHHSTGASSQITTPAPRVAHNNLLGQIFPQARQDYNGVG